MSLSENAIPQLVIQETDIPKGDNNYVEQIINQDIIIHVIEIPDLDNTSGIQNFIQTDRDIGNNNQVTQNINQTTVDFPLFSSNYDQSNSQAIENNSLSLDFNEYINNDGVLDALQFTRQQAFVEGNDNILDFYSEQRIFDISKYDQDGLDPDYVFDETKTFDDFLENFANDNLLDSVHLGVQDIIVLGDNNDLIQELDQSLATFLFIDEDYLEDLPENSSDLSPVQFAFQESFLDTNNNTIEQTINQNIQFDFSFSDEISDELTGLTGTELANPNFNIDDFILPILDQTVEESPLFENHEVLANQRNQQIADVFGNENTDIKNNNQIIILDEGETREFELENPQSTFEASLANYFDSQEDFVFADSNLI